VIAFHRAQAEALAAIFSRMATAHPNLYLAFVSAMRDADRVAADAVVGEDDPEMMLRRQGAARQLRALLVLACAPVAPPRGEERAPFTATPQV
jgi:hypothetical protein